MPRSSSLETEVRCPAAVLQHYAMPINVTATEEDEAVATPAHSSERAYISDDEGQGLGKLLVGAGAAQPASPLLPLPP